MPRNDVNLCIICLFGVSELSIRCQLVIKMFFWLDFRISLAFYWKVGDLDNKGALWSNFTMISNDILLEVIYVYFIWVMQYLVLYKQMLKKVVNIRI